MKINRENTMALDEKISATKVKISVEKTVKSDVYDDYFCCLVLQT